MKKENPGELTTPVTLLDDEIEKRVLRNILSNNSILYKAGDCLNEDLFCIEKNKKMFKEICKGVADGKVVDNIYLAQETMRNPQPGTYSFQELICDFGQFVSSPLINQDIAYLKELQLRRKYWTLGQKLCNIGSDLSYSVEDAITAINETMKDDENTNQGVITMREANEQMMKKVQENIDGTSDTFIPTGFKELDDYAGFQTTDFNIIAASTSMGKTSLALKIAVSAAKAGVPVMIYSMEMLARQLATRINSPIANISSSIIQYKKLFSDNYQALKEAVKVTNELPISFDDKATTSKQAIIRSIRMNAKRGFKLFIVDYLQIMSSVGGIKDKVKFLGETSRDFKNLARELNVNITALSQLARNNLDPYPSLDRIRDSAEISDAADTVIFIWRPSYYGKTSYKDSLAPVENTAELIIAKGRNVGNSSFIVGFNPSLTEFYDIPEEDKEKWGKVTKEEDKPFGESPYTPPHIEEQPLPF